MPVTTAFVTMDCKGMGAASVSQGGRALPAKKVRDCEGACGVILPFWQRNLRDPLSLPEQFCVS